MKKRMTVKEVCLISNQLQGENRSFWRAASRGVSYPKLAKNIKTDAAVIGGGISGILAAYLLAKSGKSVALLEAREFASGTTGGTTAKITSQHGLIYDKLIQEEGLDVAKSYYNANEKGLRLIESVADELNIECGFKEIDSYVFSKDGRTTSDLKKEARAYEQIGIDGGMSDSIPLDFNVSSALVMKKQAQFNPVTFLYGVLRELDRMETGIYQHTMYIDSEQRGDEIIVSTDTPFTVTCEDLVFATLFPAEDPESFYSNTLDPVTSHLTAYEYSNKSMREVYISDDAPKRTFRAAQDGDRSFLIAGGETHPTGDGESTITHYESLSSFIKEEFGLSEMIYYWSEHDLMTPDMRALIGKLDENADSMYVMTGYNKWGLTAAGAGAQLITDLITGTPNEYEALFCPQRNLEKRADEKNGK